MTSNKEDRSYSVDSQGMHNIELHRANSLNGPNTEFHPIEKDSSDKIEKTLDYVAEQTRSCCGAVGYMKIEVVLFLYMFSYIMRAVSSTTMIMDKSCLVHLKYSEEVCKDLKSFPIIKEEVEKLTNNYSLGHSLIQMIPSALLSLFIGSWSDKYGRKLPIMISLLGIILDGLGTALCAFFYSSRIEFYFLPALFTGFSGGFIGVLTVTYSYASDTTTFSNRTLKYAIMEIMFGLSIPLGSLAGGWLYKFFGYTVVFMTSTAGHILALVWVMFAVKETKGLDNTDSWHVKLSYLFKTQQLVDSFKATVKKRPNKGKEQIIALTVAMGFAVITYASSAGINFLYAHHQYDWDNTKYSTISAIFSVFSFVCLGICVPILKRLKLGDPSLGIIGTISLFFKNIIMGLATKKELYFIANLAGLFGGLTNLACRARISKVASQNDIGKVFAFLTTAESLIPIVATALSAQIFNATLKFYPGLIYLVLGFLMLIPIGLFIWLGRLPNVNYEEMHNDSESEETPEKLPKENEKEGV